MNRHPGYGATRHGRIRTRQPANARSGSWPGYVAIAFALGLALGGCSESAGPAGAAAAGGAPHPGEETYNRYCFSCHAAGVANAPKHGDREAWAPRIAKGRALLLETTRAGIPPGMPAMGLCLSCTDEDLVAVIDYMILAAE